MNRIPNSFIQDVLARTDIIEIIAARVELKRKGNNYSACCPFHQEKTPSFTVSQTKQLYHCFGCGESGNALQFLMTYDRLTFRDAVLELAGKLGMSPPQTDTSDNQPQVDPAAYTLMAEINQFYQRQLRVSQSAIDYLKSRGLTGQIAKQFQLGYAPTGWRKLSEQFPQKQWQSLLVTTGMVITKEANRYDRFRDRVMFPIRDLRGRTIGFGGRALNENNPPKYLNSPETPLFHKANELFGLYEIKQANSKIDHVVLVEGYLDVISLFQSGLPIAAATLGTAVNVRHIQQLTRLTSTILFCFDGDTAGQNAAWKALTLSLPLLRDGIQLKFMFLPEKEDPDSFVRRFGAEAFRAAMQAATPLSDFFFTHLARQYPHHTPDEKARFCEQAVGYFNQMPNGIFRNLMEATLCERLHISPDMLQHTITPKKASPPATPTAPSAPTPAASPQARMLQRALAILLQYPQLALQARLTPNAFPLNWPEIPLLQRLLTLLAKEPAPSLNQILDYFEEPEQRQLSRLAMTPLELDAESLAAEFFGTLQKISQATNRHRAEYLIQKAKQGSLTTEERAELQALLLDSGNEAM